MVPGQNESLSHLSTYKKRPIEYSKALYTAIENRHGLTSNFAFYQVFGTLMPPNFFASIRRVMI